MEAEETLRRACAGMQPWEVAGECQISGPGTSSNVHCLHGERTDHLLLTFIDRKPRLLLMKVLKIQRILRSRTIPFKGKVTLQNTRP